MDTFPAFSTSPSAHASVAAAFHAKDGGGSGGAAGGGARSRAVGNPNISNSSLSNSAPHTNNFSKLPSAMLFTTSPSPMMHQVQGGVSNSASSNASAAMGAKTGNGVDGALARGENKEHLGTFHVTSTLDCGAGGDGLDDCILENISQTLSVLQDIAEGRHMVQWCELLDPQNPVESAQKLNAALNNASLPMRKEAIPTIAFNMTSPQHLAIISHLKEAYRNEVRDLVLHDLLKQLAVAGNYPMPVCAEMLAELSRLNLVRLGGVAAAIEQYLNEPDKRRAGIALLGRVAEYNRSTEPFLKAIQATKTARKLLSDMYKDPEYEYDVVTITRLLSSSADGEGGVPKDSLCHHCTLTQLAPVTCMHYFRSRDELVSGQGDGTVVLWGGPNDAPTPNMRASTDSEPVLVSPRKTVALMDVNGYNCWPVSMAGPQRGHYLVVAGMPLTPSHPYAKYLEAAPALAKGRFGASAQPILRVMSCNESTGVWNNGEVFMRPANHMLTAVAALSTNIICSAESTSMLASGASTPSNTTPSSEHNIYLLNSAHGDPVRTLTYAHSDYITVLSTREENELVLLSGSKDKTVKLWDTRTNSATVGSPNTTASIPIYKLESSIHTDTISAIHTVRNFIFTGALDGTMLIWDDRRMASPLGTRSFMAPILDITTLWNSNRAVVSTARGLYLISLDTMGSLDVKPNVVYTQLRSNDSGNVVFAASADGLDVFSFHK